MRRRSFLKFLPALGVLPLVNRFIPKSAAQVLTSKCSIHGDKCGTGLKFGFTGFKPANPDTIRTAINIENLDRIDPQRLVSFDKNYYYFSKNKAYRIASE